MTLKMQTMGVMNITPNSFSDGGRHLSPTQMKNTLERFSALGVHYLDVGAESTAPMNDAVSFQEEWLRLQTFLEVLKERPWKGVVSLDSYRPKTAFAFFKELKRQGYSGEQMLWNDISGQFDEEVESFLCDFEGARYVFCHNLAPDRDMASRHMDYVKEVQSTEDFLRELFSFFHKGMEVIGQLRERVILDPCFGFSKTYEQNMALLEKFPALVADFKEQSWVFGISKKSFLRRWWSEHVEDGSRGFLIEKSEFLHLEWLGRVVRDLELQSENEASHEVIFRVHEPSLVNFLGQILK